MHRARRCCQTMFQAPRTSWNDASWQASVLHEDDRAQQTTFRCRGVRTLSIIRQVSEWDKSWSVKNQSECDSSDSHASAVKCRGLALQLLDDPSAGGGCIRRGSNHYEVATVCPCLSWLQASLGETLAVPWKISFRWPSTRACMKQWTRWVRRLSWFISRLDPGAKTPSPNVELDASEGLLNYSLLQSMEGKTSPVFETDESRDVACGAWVPRFSASLESSSGRVRRIQLLSG